MCAAIKLISVCMYHEANYSHTVMENTGMIFLFKSSTLTTYSNIVVKKGMGEYIL